MPPSEENLSPEELVLLGQAVARIQKRRRIMLVGYALALLVMLVGVPLGLLVWARAPRGAFIGWVFLVPLGITGLILWLFGRWARLAGNTKDLGLGQHRRGGGKD